MPVNSQHKNYAAYIRKTKKVIDCYNSLDESSGAEHIVKRPSEKDDDIAHQLRTTRAIFTNYVKRTAQGLVGAVFRKSPNIELPPSTEHLMEDADSSGRSLSQFMKDGLTKQIRDGFFCLIAEYPALDRPITLEEQKRSGVRSYLTMRDGASVINYRMANINGRYSLSMIVFKESIAKATPDDPFIDKCEDQFRVLEMIDGAYHVSVYDNKFKRLEGYPKKPRAAGQSLDHIPVYFVGAESNLPEYQDSPLYDIAIINIGHYRNSADQETNLSIHAGGTLILKTEKSSEDFQASNPSGLRVGDNSAVLLETEGGAELLQLDAAQAIDTAMEQKEKRIVQIGAKIIEKGSGNETAEAARIRAAGEHSMLDDIVMNLESGFKKAMMDCAAFDGGDPDAVRISVNRKYWWEKLDAQEAMALIAMIDARLLRRKRAVEMLQESGIEDAEETVDNIIQLIDNDNPV